MRKLKVFPIKEGFVGCSSGMYLKLIENPVGVEVVACDARGVILDNGYLMIFHHSGVVRLHSRISKDLGLDLRQFGVLNALSYIEEEQVDDDEEDEIEAGEDD
jgi:hypothetical protein